MEVVASLSQDRTAAAQCGLFTYKSVPVIFEPPCICLYGKFDSHRQVFTTVPGETWLLNFAKCACVVNLTFMMLFFSGCHIHC